MFKKTLICLAVASSVALTGCLGGNGTGKNAGAENAVTSDQYSGRSYPIFNPIETKLPVPDDLFYNGTNDGTFVVSGTDPIKSALDQLSGASTNAPIDIPFNGKIDASSVDADSVIPNPAVSNSFIPNPHQDVFLIKLKYASGDPLSALKSLSTKYPEPPTSPYAEALSNPNTIGQALYSRYKNEPYTAKVLDLNGQTVLRILPKQPLDANTRYLVVLTNGIKDPSGNPLIGSPSFEAYSNNTNYATNPLIDPVRDLINKFWDPIALSYFGTLNSVRKSAGLNPLDKSNIVLSYSLTTSGDQAVLQDVEDPTHWAYNLVKTQIADGAVKAALTQNPSLTEHQLEQAVSQAQGAYTSPAAPCSSAPPGDTSIKCTAQAIIGGVQLNGGSFPAPQSVSSLVQFSPVVPTIQSGSNSLQFPNQARFISAYIGKIYQDIFSSQPPAKVDVVQGTMTIPYYLGQPAGSDGTPITSDTWTPDDTLATKLNGALGLSGDKGFPQANGKSSNVNYLFPFPDKQSDQPIPVLAMYPDGALTNNSPNSLTTVIFQHGITTDRSAALTIGSAMIQAYKQATGGNLAVIAIDQPLHGVVLTNSTDESNMAVSLLGYDPLKKLTPAQQTAVTAVVNGTYHDGVLQSVQGCAALTGVSSEQKQIMVVLSGACDTQTSHPSAQMLGALEIENSAQHPGSTVPGLPHTDNERTFDFTMGPNGTAIPQTASAGKKSKTNPYGNASGSLFINLGNFINGRDNLREAVLDLLTLRKSIDKMDLNHDGTADLDANNVYFVGHSLGAIDGGVFAAIANAQDYNGNYNSATELKGVDLIAPGGGIVRLLDNSPSFADAILSGLAANGLSTGDVNLETFFNVDQAAVDAADPINFVGYWKANKKPMLLTEFLGDQVIPNYPNTVSDPSTRPCYQANPPAYRQGLNLLCGSSLGNVPERDAPLSGGEALLNFSGSTKITATGLTAFPGTDTVLAARYDMGSHTTPVLPTRDPNAKEQPGLSDALQAAQYTDEKAAFSELVEEAVSMMVSGGTTVKVQNGSALKTQY